MTSERFKKLILICLLLIAYCLFSSHADAFDVKRTVLPNGLIVLHSAKHSLPIVMVTLLVKASPLDEPEEKAGLANLVAKLLTEGTMKRKSTDISEEIEFIGASLNTSVSDDYTKITLSVLKKDVDKGFEIFSDILLNPVFEDSEIERKKKLIKGFLKQREEDPSFLARRAFKKEVFGKHPYGRLIEGSFETLENINRQDIVRFYSDYFLPNNSILSVVGDITEEELNSLIEKYLGGWSSRLRRPDSNFCKRSSELPQGVFSGWEKKKVIKIDKDLTQANIIIGHIGIRRDNPDYYAVTAMNYILGGGGFSSRLMQSIRDKMGLAYDVHSFFSANKENGSFQVTVQTKNESANEVIAEILSQIESIRKEYVSEEELSDAKSYLTGNFLRRLDTNRKIANFLATAEFYSLGLDYVKKYPLYINSITKDDILRVAKKYLDPENYVLVVVGNQRKVKLKY